MWTFSCGGCGDVGGGQVFGAAGGTLDGRIQVLQDPNFFFGEKAPMAALNVFLGKTGVHDAVEASDIVAQMLEDATNNTVAAAVDLEANLGFIF